MPWLRHRHLKPEFLTVHDAVDGPGVKSCEVVEERPRGADIAAAWLGTEAGCMRAHALVVVKLMVADIALAAVMPALTFADMTMVSIIMLWTSKAPPCSHFWHWMLGSSEMQVPQPKCPPLHCTNQSWL
jgi:hypothetical protein